MTEISKDSVYVTVSGLNNICGPVTFLFVYFHSFPSEFEDFAKLPLIIRNQKDFFSLLKSHSSCLVTKTHTYYPQTSSDLIDNLTTFIYKTFFYQQLNKSKTTLYTHKDLPAILPFNQLSLPKTSATKIVQVILKEIRNQTLLDLHKKLPDYEILTNKGKPTYNHYKLILELGKSDYHRNDLQNNILAMHNYLFKKSDFRFFEFHNLLKILPDWWVSIERNNNKTVKTIYDYYTFEEVQNINISYKLMSEHSRHIRKREFIELVMPRNLNTSFLKWLNQHWTSDDIKDIPELLLTEEHDDINEYLDIYTIY